MKSAIRLPPNDCVQRDIAELHSKTWELGQKGCRGAKSGWKAYQVVAVLHPMEPGSTPGDLVVRYLGTQSELRQRIGALAMKKGQSWSLSAAASQWGFTTGLKEKRQ